MPPDLLKSEEPKTKSPMRAVNPYAIKEKPKKANTKPNDEEFAYFEVLFAIWKYGNVDFSTLDYDLMRNLNFMIRLWEQLTGVVYFKRWGQILGGSKNGSKNVGRGRSKR
jgi:hypothetical protein